MLLSSNVALIGGNSTKPGSSYDALIKAVLCLELEAYEASATLPLTDNEGLRQMAAAESNGAAIYLTQAPSVQ